MLGLIVALGGAFAIALLAEFFGQSTATEQVGQFREIPKPTPRTVSEATVERKQEVKQEPLSVSGVGMSSRTRVVASRNAQSLILETRIICLTRRPGYL